jgi:hypothetical protein
MVECRAKKKAKPRVLMRVIEIEKEQTNASND